MNPTAKSPESVQRYELEDNHLGGESMCENSEGSYVLTVDHVSVVAELSAEVDRLKGELFLMSENSIRWQHKFQALSPSESKPANSHVTSMSVACEAPQESAEFEPFDEKAARDFADKAFTEEELGRHYKDVFVGAARWQHSLQAKKAGR